MRATSRLLAGLAALGLVAALAGPAFAASITIVNVDGPGEGFNDPTPAAPVGGNPGTTIGQQRLIVFQHAASIWGSILPSGVPIFVRSAFNPLTCTATSAVLGSAGTIQVFRDFPNAEFPATWYPGALADKIAGADLNPGDDISAQFNSSINGNPGCLGGATWYYGLDGNEGPGTVELLPVVLHEIGHGLGFATLVNKTNGARFNNFDDVYMKFLRDNTLGQLWPTMTNAQRRDNITSLDKLAWDGDGVRKDADNWLGPRPVVRVTAPGGIAGDYVFTTGSFGQPVGLANLTAEVVLADDGNGTTSDACEPIQNDVSGKIALIDRGACAFVVKAAAAQAAGAVAVIIANNVAGPPIPMGGSDPSLVIPVVMVSQADGATLKANLPGVTVFIGGDPGHLAGADDDGRPLMYAPNPVQTGSSVSHWDVSASPNLLMEPAISGNLSSSVDLTRALFKDIGWLEADFPDCSGATAVVPVIWPPNHELVPVTIVGVSDPGGGDAQITVTGITQDEPINGRGDGNTCPDGAILDGQAWVRMERSGNGNGRVYEISFTATTEKGAICNGTVKVCVPHDEFGECVDDGQAVESIGPCKGNNAITSEDTPVLDLKLVTMRAGTATVEYALPSTGRVSLSVFDVAGRRLATLENGIREAGIHSATWAPGNAGQGVYFYRLETDGGTITRSVLHVH